MKPVVCHLKWWYYIYFPGTLCYFITQSTNYVTFSDKNADYIKLNLSLKFDALKLASVCKNKAPNLMRGALGEAW